MLAIPIRINFMMEGSQQILTFEKTYNHILNYSYKNLYVNPMIMAKAKAFWESKQNLMQEFTFTI